MLEEKLSLNHQIETSQHHLKDGIIDFTSGCLGGIALVYVGQPLDTVKVKMQTFPSLYTNMVDCFKKTYIQDGICRGLYAGTIPALATNVVENSVLFLCYGFCQKIIINMTGANSAEDLTVLANAWAGFLASFFSSVAITPTELIKCKLQAMHEVNNQAVSRGLTPPKYISPLGLTREIARNEGVRGLFRGLVPTLAREMPGYFFFFGGYEGTRDLLRKPDQKKEDIGLLRTMVAGGVGGGVFWITTFPFDVAKSRIQVNNISDNLIKTLSHIVKNEGISALYKGLTPTLVRTIPATATLFATVEYSKRLFNFLF
ncbi:mitochondrial ornithine transporter 1 [Anthonomus grandis grandis]|uniref:mitochondrial ornithine transporter 1 n=1 Tax=Anthonomus grandis grandis TaxID=2921223 RepID=UPI00216509AE|nr:mitochondrial ornithine transporter 1 [Anthonomus grandis grandis]XP_050304213.1 mitochondrial ornithine transporter 1 [Anthonomus grandis grandis]